MQGLGIYILYRAFGHDGHRLKIRHNLDKNINIPIIDSSIRQLDIGQVATASRRGGPCSTRVHISRQTIR